MRAHPTTTNVLRSAALAAAAAALLSPIAAAQGGASGPMREAMQLDSEGRTVEARAIFQTLIESAADEAQRASAYRSMAMSYAFDNDCDNTMKYELLAMAYWMTREAAEPQEAFYQEGERLNEGARVCIEAGNFDAAERWYRMGYERGTLEPEPVTHPRSLWDFRLAHALGRIEARRGNAAVAWFHVANARRILDGDPAMAEQQERFFPYLEGYVALFTGDLERAETVLAHAAEMQGNQRDPFMRWLLATTYDRQGRTAEAEAAFRQAYDLSGGHNPPAAFVRSTLRPRFGM